jgi:hypothetical protein
MTNGGSTPVGDERRGRKRSRTTVVIDHLLSRGPLTAQLATGAADCDGAEPWVSVLRVLHHTAPSILEGHLTWLVAGDEDDHHRSCPSIAVEDQTRILIRALEGDALDEVVIRALEQPWDAGIVPDDDAAIARYASELRTERRPHGGRTLRPPGLGPGAAPRRLSGSTVSRRPLPGRVPPSCPPSR